MNVKVSTPRPETGELYLTGEVDPDDTLDGAETVTWEGWLPIETAERLAADLLTDRRGLELHFMDGQLDSLDGHQVEARMIGVRDHFGPRTVQLCLALVAPHCDLFIPHLMIYDVAHLNHRERLELGQALLRACGVVLDATDPTAHRPDRAGDSPTPPQARVQP